MEKKLKTLEARLDAFINVVQSAFEKIDKNFELFTKKFDAVNTKFNAR